METDMFVEETAIAARSSFYAVKMPRKDTGVEPTVFAIMAIGSSSLSRICGSCSRHR